MVLHAAEMEVLEVRLGGSKGQIGVWVLVCGLQALCCLCKALLELMWGQGRRAASGTGIMFVAAHAVGSSPCSCGCSLVSALSNQATPLSKHST